LKREFRSRLERKVAEGYMDDSEREDNNMPLLDYGLDNSDDDATGPLQFGVNHDNGEGFDATSSSGGLGFGSDDDHEHAHEHNHDHEHEHDDHREENSPAMKNFTTKAAATKTTKTTNTTPRGLQRFTSSKGNDDRV
jgi:ABC-type Zn2+ transport system substrate-binding protein/surface adhesin